MNRKRLIKCFALITGLFVMPAAGVRAGGGSAGAAALARVVSRGDRSDAAGTSPATSEWWAKVAAPLGARPRWKADGDQDGAQFGNAVGAAGDVNADGYDDAIVGAYFYDNGQMGEGGAAVFRGQATVTRPR